MIKKIPVTQLKVGMYINDLSHVWETHPFERNYFLLKDAAALKEIISANLAWVEIDTDQGLDAEECVVDLQARPPASVIRVRGGVYKLCRTQQA